MTFRKLPKKLKFGRRSIRIREKKLSALSGMWEPNLWEIQLCPNQHPVERGVTFLHELIHYLEDEAIRKGKLGRRISHTFVEDIARGVYWAMVQLGHLPRCTWKTFRKESKTIDD